MFEDKNPMKKYMEDFRKENGFSFGGTYPYEQVLTYVNLVETRIQNNLLLLNNPLLCAQYGINTEDLSAELDSLMEIRQKISFSDIQNKKTR